ncbi:unnamed protein product [Arabis nemorensis]|uniref:RNase H type-1 domain-containing protein n=1 Tax=Arabis nemorensis TaxID=586526 RepID=A0A565BDF0_9BRAS|nr:unnamed protein product [Arabis nemorensis]
MAHRISYNEKGKAIATSSSDPRVTRVKTRNELIFNNKSSLALEVVSKSIRDVKEWQDKQERKTKPAEVLVARQSDEPIGEVVCQTDAAWREDIHVAGLGWVFKYHNQQTVQHFTRAVTHVCSPLMAEGLAIRSALLKAVEKTR